jgi:hypothetical protein
MEFQKVAEVYMVNEVQRLHRYGINNRASHILSMGTESLITYINRSRRFYMYRFCHVVDRLALCSMEGVRKKERKKKIE